MRLAANRRSRKFPKEPKTSGRHSSIPMVVLAAGSASEQAAGMNTADSEHGERAADTEAPLEAQGAPIGVPLGANAAVIASSSCRTIGHGNAPCAWDGRGAKRKRPVCKSQPAVSKFAAKSPFGGPLSPHSNLFHGRVEPASLILVHFHADELALDLGPLSGTVAEYTVGPLGRGCE